MATPSYMWTPWRKGSASDSRSEGCVFESRRGQLAFFALRKTKSGTERRGNHETTRQNKWNVLLCWKFLSFPNVWFSCHNLNKVKREVGGRSEGCRPLICMSMDESALWGPLEGTAYNAPSIWGSFAQKACRFQSCRTWKPTIFPNKV